MKRRRWLLRRRRISKPTSTLETAVSRSTKADPESTNEGHPDKICDQIPDVVIDVCLTCDAKCKIACETCVKDNMFMVASEITVAEKMEHKTVVRGVAQNIGIDSFIDDSSRVDNKGLHYQDCEVLFHVNKQRADIAEGLHVDRDDLHAGNGYLWWSCSDGETQVTDVPVLTRTAAAQHRSTQQHNHHKEEQPTEQAMQEGEREQREEVEKGQEERERGERGKKEKGGKEEERDAEEEGREQVKKDVTSWTVVTRNKREKRRTIQIFVKVNESRTFPLDVSPDDKVDDVIKQIQSEEDVYVTLHGSVLKRSEKLKSEVTDGCMSRHGQDARRRKRHG